MARATGTKLGQSTPDAAPYLGENIQRVGKNLILAKVSDWVNWGRKSSLWPMLFGISCCAIEMMAVGASRFDLDRFGAGKFSGSPRQSDMMIVAGTVTYKMAEVVKRLYDQMPDPKWVISMGGCASSGGPFNTYSVLQGIDKVVPVDVYVLGCPPTPDNLLHGIMVLQKKIMEQGYEYKLKGEGEPASIQN